MSSGEKLRGGHHDGLKGGAAERRSTGMVAEALGGLFDRRWLRGRINQQKVGMGRRRSSAVQ
jgi:hypothetical protein